MSQLLLETKNNMFHDIAPSAFICQFFFYLHQFPLQHIVEVFQGSVSDNADKLRTKQEVFSIVSTCLTLL